jgi:hypothetical protein
MRGSGAHKTKYRCQKYCENGADFSGTSQAHMKPPYIMRAIILAELHCPQTL